MSNKKRKILKRTGVQTSTNTELGNVIKAFQKLYQQTFSHKQNISFLFVRDFVNEIYAFFLLLSFYDFFCASNIKLYCLPTYLELFPIHVLSSSECVFISCDPISPFQRQKICMRLISRKPLLRQTVSTVKH